MCLRGSMSLQLAVIMVPVLFGMMGFAIDLGRLYLIRGELNQAATAMALAAAAQLVGTSASLGNATTAAQQSLDDSNHLGNKYNFGSLIIGQTTGNLTSTVNDPGLFRHRRRRHRLLRQHWDRRPTALPRATCRSA
jgi:Flp pilus assembly protein TadG